MQLSTPLRYYGARGAGLPTHDAADLVQEVLVVLVQKLSEFEYDRGKSFRGWMRTMALLAADARVSGVAQDDQPTRFVENSAVRKVCDRKW